MSVPSSFEAAAFARTPRWLRGTWADRLLTVVYGLFDVANEAHRQAAKSALVAVCPDDAVDVHTEERMMERRPGESTASLRDRVALAWRFWTTLSPGGLEIELRSYLSAPALEVYDIANDGWLAGFAGTGYDDDDADNWSRLVVVIPQSHPWVRETVGPGLVVGPELLVGISMTGSELSTLRRVFRRYAPAHIVGIGVDVLFGSTSAGSYKANHAVTTEVVRMPLDVQMVGYEQHGMTVGPGLIVGYRFT